jgi:7,8-dihydro-6-hydroxymethylpterin-pyrophosphokinase
MTNHPVHHQVLIGLYAGGGNRLNSLRKMVRQLKTLGSLDKVSSVQQVLYEKTKKGLSTVDPESSPQTASLAVAVTLQTSRELNDLMQGLDLIQQDQDLRSIECRVLLYEDRVKMTPSATVPFPNLHREPQWLVPAAEISGSIVHPIINKTLSLILSEQGFKPSCRFFCQSKSLLDFSDNAQ